MGPAKRAKRSRIEGDAPNFSARASRHLASITPFILDRSTINSHQLWHPIAEEGESINRDVLGLRLAMGNGTADTDTEDTEVQKDEIELAF